MTPSDQRLHPLSILFDLGAQAKAFLVPALFVFFGAGSAGIGWEALGALMLIPYAGFVIARYFTFTYRYEAGELVIRSGLLVRNERHIPLARIQNIDAVQNVLHRLLGVVEVRLQTGGGSEPEATLRVLPLAALEDMRRQVFGQRVPAAAGAEGVEGADASAQVAASVPHALLALPFREIVIYGLVHNRGALVIAAVLGVVWETGLFEGAAERVLGPARPGRAVLREMAATVFGGAGPVASRVVLGLLAFVALLVVIRLLSIAWAFVRLYGFRLSRVGEDLRTEYGLLTRVVATIPLRRIQTVTVRDGPLHRLFGRVSVRVTTAGGAEGTDGGVQREWLAPILPADRVPELLREVLPEVDLAGVAWQRVHPRAFGRELRVSLVVVALICAPVVAAAGWWALAVFAALAAWAALSAHRLVTRLAWATTDAVVCLRSGAWLRYVSFARFAKIQVVALHESPFDRRSGMARVRVDTAGAGDAYRVDIPYLALDTARTVHRELARQAATTAFKW